MHRIETDGIAFAIPGMCCQELLAEAARIMVDCRERGISFRGTIDCLIAQLTLETEGVLLHSDKEFNRRVSRFCITGIR